MTDFMQMSVIFLPPTKKSPDLLPQYLRMLYCDNPRKSYYCHADITDIRDLKHTKFYRKPPNGSKIIIGRHMIMLIICLFLQN
jgi:hypothetical protein